MSAVGGVLPADERAPSRTAWLTAAVTLAIFVLLAASTAFRTVPSITADEIGYLSVSRYLSGGGATNLGYVEFYYFGFGLLMAPFDYFISDPRQLYRVATLLNSALAAAVVPVLLALARQMSFRITAATVLAAGILALWPGYVVYAYLALPEPAFRLAFLLLVLAAFAAVRTAGFRAVLVFAVLTVCLFSLHPRALPVVPTAVLFLGALGFTGRKTLVQVATAIAVIIAGAIVVITVNGYFQHALWLNQTSIVDKIRALGVAFKSLRGVGEFIGSAIGQLWYQVVATLGLAVVGFAVVVRGVLSPGDTGRRLVLAFIVLATIGTALAGAAQLIHPTSLEITVYSRYLDGVTPVLFWLGALTCLAAAPSPLAKRAMLAALIAALVVALLLYLVNGNRGLDPSNEAMVASLLVPLHETPTWMPQAVRLYLLPAMLAAIGMAIIRVSLGRLPGILAILVLVVAISDASLYHYWQVGQRLPRTAAGAGEDAPAHGHRADLSR